MPIGSLVLLGAAAHAAAPAILPYQGPGIRFEVELLDAQGQRVAVPMLLDTGSTLTTMSAEALRQLGIEVPADAPSVVAATAGGMRESRLLLLDRMWLGGHEVRPVTVAVCDECADPDSAGLVGLNVLDRFSYLVDSRQRRLVFTSQDPALGHATDIGAWAGLLATVRADAQGAGQLEVGVASDAPRVIEEVRLEVSCGVSREVTVGPVPPGATAKVVVAVGEGLLCEELQVTVVGARWGG